MKKKLDADPKLQGQVIIKEKQSADKLVRFFFAEGLEDIGPMILNDVIKPAVRTLAYEIFVKSAAAAFFGKDNIPSTINASTYSNASRKINGVSSNPVKKNNFIMNNIYVASKAAGVYYVQRIKAVIKEYGVASVADVYDIAEQLHTEPNYNNWGWRKLERRDEDYITLTASGWMIKLPEPEPISRII